mgnify:CR=1 FL=1
MSVQDKLNRLQDRYVKWYVENVSDCKEDALQSWWERTREMNTWSVSKGRFVPMSDTQAFTTLREWFAEKSAINSYLQSKLYANTITSEEREIYFKKVYGNQYLA